jgi:hypothetical protein
MINAFGSVLKTLLRLHWFIIAILFMAQILSVFALRTILFVAPFSKTGYVSDSAYSEAMLCMAFSYAFFILFLGLMFNTRSRSGWLHQLPVSGHAFVLLPFVAILTYASLLFYFVPWGIFTSGIGMVLFGVPLLCFLIIKNCRNLITGVIKSGAFAIVLYALWLTVLLEWGARAELWHVDALYLCAFAALCLLFEAKQRMLVLLAPAVLLLSLSVKLATVEFQTPSTFARAVYDLSFLDSEKTRSEFKRLALDPKAWTTLDSYSLPSFIRAKAQLHSATLLSPNEQLLYFKHIEANDDRWEPQQLSYAWKSRPSAFPKPVLIFAGSGSNEPIGFLITQKPLTDYLYANWKDTDLYCSTLPFERSVRFVQRLFESDCGFPRLLRDELWATYSLDRPGAFESSIDHYLVNRSANLAPNIRRYLQSGAPFDIYNLERTVKNKYQRSIIQNTLSDKDLSALKNDLRLVRHEFLKGEHGSKEEFKTAVLEATSPFPKGDGGALLLFNLVTGSANVYQTKRNLERRDPFLMLQYFWLGAGDINVGFTCYWIRQVLLDDANWPQIQTILADAKGSS